MKMKTCSSCGSFVPGTRACPACGTAVVEAPRGLPSALRLAGGSLVAITLSACYGMAYEPYDRTDASANDAGASALTAGCDDPALDLDGDGFCGAKDCDEADAAIHEGAFDAFGDGVDADCGGTDAID